MLKSRILTALVGIPLVLGLIWLGGLSLVGFISLIALLATYELTKVLNFAPLLIYGLSFFAFITPLATYFHNLSPLVLFFVLLLGLGLLKVFKNIASTELGLAIFCYLYIPVLLCFAVLLLKKPQGSLFILLILITTWITDTFAYLTGSLVGRHKLAPTISPNKTVEGLIGSLLVVSLGLPFIVNYFFASIQELNFSLPVLVFISISLALTATAGDLFESALKRCLKIKDTGSLLPGHGGILDRIDSLLFTLPLGYFFVEVLIK